MTSAEGAIHCQIRSRMKTESRFQRLFICDSIPGAMPQAEIIPRLWR